jgi:polyribonucleotide nucleotidyltransferase
MSWKFEVDLGNYKEIYEIDKVAKQAAGSALVRVGNAVMLATVARDEKPIEEDFVPLTVQYVEKQYAAGRIPGGYLKRETKPGDLETLTSRIIDRSLRPLFPKGYKYPTQITVFVLSSDNEVDMQVMALNAASAAFYNSSIAVDVSVCGVRVAKIDDTLVANPTLSQLKKSSLDLYVAGTHDQLLMIEMRSIASNDNQAAVLSIADPIIDAVVSEKLTSSSSVNEFTVSEMMEAIDFAAESIKNTTAIYQQIFQESKRAHDIYELSPTITNQEIYDFVAQNYPSEVKSAVSNMAKSERNSELKALAKTIATSESAIQKEWCVDDIYTSITEYKKSVVRAMILDDRVRADGRALDEVRPISIETNILPSAHGSCLFTRGQTQALVVTTLGSDQDAQMYDTLNEKTTQTERFMLQYNFPGFSVGEASPLRAPGRRELGHGNLAKRAVEPTLDPDMAQTIRVVSEILESNGSSSMATVCGSSLALRAAGISTKKLVAGVAMGLVVEDDKYAVLTDIMGLEDHDGDMDFKVAGTEDGITALQMDIKLGGVDRNVLQEALIQASSAKEHILSIMKKADNEIQINDDILPSLEIFSVDPSKIVDIIGQAGKTIREIIEKFEVSIDLDREKGDVKLMGESKAKVTAAKEHITEIVERKPSMGGRDRRGPRDRGERKKIDYEVGSTYKSSIKKIMEFGAFVELPGGVDGLLHISKLTKDRSAKINDLVTEGDDVEVVVLSQKGHKVELGLKEQQ